eukprot:3386488-Prymnesium_polylepis.1
MSPGLCITCNKTITEDQDYTTLTCHAAGQTISHTTYAHDKCWEKFKKSFVRGRGTANRTQNFFCPVANCHNALEHQHLAARKKEGQVDRRAATGDGPASAMDGEYASLPGSAAKGAAPSSIAQLKCAALREVFLPAAAVSVPAC